MGLSYSHAFLGFILCIPNSQPIYKSIHQWRRYLPDSHCECSINTHFYITSYLASVIAMAVADLPLEFPDGTTPVTCRVSIYDSSTDSKVGVGSLMDKAVVPALPAGSLYMEEVHAKVRYVFGLLTMFPDYGFCWAENIFGCFIIPVIQTI